MSAGNGFVGSSPDARYGDGTSAFANGEPWAQRFQAPGAGSVEISEIGLYAFMASPGAMRLAIFADDAANGCPGAVVANSQTVPLYVETNGSVPYKVFSDYGEPLVLMGGDYYWIGSQQEHTLTLSRFASGPGDIYSSTAWWSDWPTDSGWHTHTDISDRNASLYAVYSEGSAGGFAPILARRGQPYCARTFTGY